MSETHSSPVMSEVPASTVNEAPSFVPSLTDQAKNEILAQAQKRGASQNLKCAGAITPDEAWALVEAEKAVIVDVRTLEEYKLVGRVPHSVHVPWMCGLSMVRNPGFIHDVKKLLPLGETIILLCRSGQRSAGAAEAMTRAGYTSVYNLDEGFEGMLDGNRQRGTINGWRHRGLPWFQD